jgi:hypothetical protein
MAMVAASCMAMLTGTVSGDACSCSRLEACGETSLMELLSTREMNRTFPDICPDEVREAIARRVHLDTLLARIATTTDESQRADLVDVASHRTEAIVAVAFRRVLSRTPTKSACGIAVYLARRGDQKALDILRENYWKCPVSSWEWSYVVPVFADQHYYPATDALIDSLDAASLNLVMAAMETLQRLYPGGPAEFGSPKQAMKYFRGRSQRAKGAKTRAAEQ